MAHEGLGEKSKLHKPGCVTRHIPTYDEGNTCSHRWQAARKALAEKRVNYLELDDSDERKRATRANRRRASAFFRRGQSIAKATVAKGLVSYTLKPFATVD